MTTPLDDLEQKVDLLLENMHLREDKEQLQQKTRLLEEEVEELKPSQPGKKLKPGRVGVLLNDSHRDYINNKARHLNGLQVTVTDGNDNKDYQATQNRYGEVFYLPSRDENGNRINRNRGCGDYGPTDGYCEFSEMPGGNYKVSVRYGNETFGVDITIDGDTLVELTLSESNKIKEDKNKPSNPSLVKPYRPSHFLKNLSRTKLLGISLIAALGIAGISFYVLATRPVNYYWTQLPDGTYKYEDIYLSGRRETYICDDSEKKTCKPVTE